MNKRARTRFIIGFLAPASIFYAGLFLWPLIQSFAISMFRWRGISGKKTFVGFQNFTTLLDDVAFKKAITHNLWLLVVSGICVFSLGILIAHGIQHKSKIASVMRGLYLFPHVISLVAVSILWQFILNPAFGILTSALKGLGLGAYVKPWLGDPSTALACVGGAFIWYVIGFYIMLFSAGLRSIGDEVKEAAELDGVTGLKKFFSITWPLLWSVKRTASIYLVINVMNIFALVFLMTKGGPDRGTETMLTYLYEQSFRNMQFGYGTALAVVNFLAAMVLSAVLALVYRKSPERGRA